MQHVQKFIDHVEQRYRKLFCKGCKKSFFVLPINAQERMCRCPYCRRKMLLLDSKLGLVSKFGITLNALLFEAPDTVRAQTFLDLLREEKPEKPQMVFGSYWDEIREYEVKEACRRAELNLSGDWGGDLEAIDSKIARDRRECDESYQVSVRAWRERMKQWYLLIQEWNATTCNEKFTLSFVDKRELRDAGVVA